MEKLNILWTTSEKDVVKNMLSMYAINSMKKGWWEKVNLIIWGGSAKLISEDVEIQELVRQMLNAGVTIEACQACAQKYDAVELFKQLGADVKYMGQPLTDYIKSGAKMLTI